MTTPIAQGPRGLPGSAATRKSTTAPKCEKCGCPGVLNTGNADGGKSSEWRCWGWQCRHKWETPNVEHDRRPAALSQGVRVDGPVGPHTQEK